MAQYTLPTVSRWENEIQLIGLKEHAARGYDKATDTDGPANMQALPLGNRTLFLKDVLLDGHDDDGHHQLRDADFLPDTQIPESALDLDHGTESLKTCLLGAKDMADDLNAGVGDNPSFTLAVAMRKAIPLSWEYANYTHTQELFTDGISMRAIPQLRVLRAVAGDDSLDVEDTSLLREGETYLLSDADGARTESVYVSSILTDHRVIASAPLGFSRTSGMLSSTNLVIADGVATAPDGAFVYTTKLLDALEGEESGELILRHSPTDATGTVYLQEEGYPEWEEVPQVDQVTIDAEHCDDIYQITGLSAGRFRIKVVYTGGSAPITVNHLFLSGETDTVWVEQIRRPKILYANRVGSNGINVVSSGFGTLYGFTHVGSGIQIISDEGVIGSAYLVSASTDLLVTLPRAIPATATIWAQVRHRDSIGNVSRWSPARFVGGEIR